MSVSRIASAALLCLGVATPVVAQDSTSQTVSRAPSELARRSSGTATFVQSRPLGDLSANIGFGYGLNGAYLLRIDRAGILSLRADAGIVQYGNETFRVPFSNTVGGRVRVKVSTDNYIVPLSIGPQLAVPSGIIRPYVTGGVAAQVFYTESSVDGTDDYAIASTTNQADWTSSWVAGGGVYVPIYTKTMSILLDAGVRYFGAGHARYLRPGSIKDLSNAQIQITPLESDTRLVLVHLGVRIGL